MSRSSSRAAAAIALVTLASASTLFLVAGALGHRGAIGIGLGEHARFALGRPSWLRAVAIAPCLAALPLLPTLAASVRPSWRVAARAIAGAAIGAVAALALSEPRLETRAPAPAAHACVVALVDGSDSISAAQRGEAEAVIASLARARGANDRLRLVEVGARPRVLGRAEGAPPVARGPRGAGLAFDGTATDLAAAIRLAVGLCPAASTVGADGTDEARALLLSDGAETVGDAIAAARDAGAAGFAVDVHPLREPPPEDLAVRGLTAPTRAAPGEPFAATAEIAATRAVRARVSLAIDGAPSPVEPERTVALAAGLTRVRLVGRVERSQPRVDRRAEPRAPALAASHDGPVEVRVRVAPVAGVAFVDRFVDDDEAAAAVAIEGGTRALFVEGDTAAPTPLARILDRAGLVVARGALPASAAALAPYDLVVLSNVASLGASESAALARWVDGGGGLLFAAGPRVTGVAYEGTPVGDLLPVRFEVERARPRRRVALLLAIDRSGSMQGERLALARQAARASASLLAPDDLVGVVAFDVLAETLGPLRRAADREPLLADLGRVRGGGGTAFLPALEKAHETLAPAPADVKHVILLTDGEASYEGVAARAEAMRREGITVSAVGVGEGADKTLLRTIADVGGGRFYATDDAGDVPRLFVRDTAEVQRPALAETTTRLRPGDAAASERGRGGVLVGVDLDRAPPIAGHMATRATPEGRVVLATEAGGPLLVLGRAGLGAVAAWTSDVSGRWSSSLLGSPQGGRLFAQVARKVARGSLSAIGGSGAGAGAAESALSIEYEEGGDDTIARVVADVRDADDRFLGGLASRATLVDAGGALPPVDLAMREAGPGRYEADVARGSLAGGGVVVADRAWLVRAEHRDGRGAVVAASLASLSFPPPREHTHLHVDVPRLEAIAAASGGRVDPSAADSYSPRAPPSPPPWHRRDAKPPLCVMAVCLLVVDAFLRVGSRRRA